MDKFILLFGFDDVKGQEQASALASKAKILDIGVRTVGPDQYDAPLFSLADEVPDAAFSYRMAAAASCISFFSFFRTPS